MTVHCDKCGKTYATNAALYRHKAIAHPEPRLLLINHGDTRKRPPTYNTPPKPKRQALPPVTKHIHPPEKPVEHEIRPNPDDGQDDDDLKIVDSYDNDGQSDDGLKIVDRYDNDGQSDDGLTVVDSIDTPDYKKLYIACLKSKKSIKEECQRKVNEIKAKCEKKIADMKDEYKSKLREHGDEMKEQYEDRLKKLRDEQTRKIKDLEEIHKKAFDKYEQECRGKIKLLNDQLQAEKEDDEDMSSLTKAIFNCNTMEEIFKIQKLVNNHQIDELVQNHLPTLQNLFLSLSYGILPICQPQREQVTNEQRRIVNHLQTASRQSAKTILRDKRAEVINLFTIIKDSIKLARDTYNRYGASV